MKRINNESGFAQLLLALGVTLVLAAGASVYYSVTSIMQDSGPPTVSTKTSLKETRAFIGPQPPAGTSDPCSIEAAHKAGIEWTGSTLGWRKTGNDDEPRFSNYLGDANNPTADNSKAAGKAYTAAFNAWYDQMQGLVAEAKSNWERAHCGETIQESPAPVSSGNPSQDIPGTYTLELRNPPCPGFENSLPRTFQVFPPQSSTEVGIIFEGQQTQLASLSGYHLTAEWTEGGINYRVSADFLAESGKEHRGRDVHGQRRRRLSQMDTHQASR